MGAQLALACDVVVVSTTARFAELFVRRAIVPDGGAAYVLSRVLPLHVAKRLLLFGGELDSAEATARASPIASSRPTSCTRRRRRWPRSWPPGPTTTLGLTKRLLNRAAEQGRTVAFDDEAMAQEINVATADAAEGLASFRERRVPRVPRMVTRP